MHRVTKECVSALSRRSVGLPIGADIFDIFSGVSCITGSIREFGLCITGAGLCMQENANTPALIKKHYFHHRESAKIALRGLSPN